MQVAVLLDSRVTRVSNDRVQTQPGQICQEIAQDHVHILIDSTGLNIHVGTLRKPPKNRDWRKLHISVNAVTGQVIACDLTSKSARDASRVPALLKQIDGPLASVRADGA